MLLGAETPAAPTCSAERTPKEHMDPLTLAGVDRPLTPIVLGTMTFGDSVDERAAAAMIEDFLAAGGTGIDTANGYAGGRSETMLAQLLRGRRDQMVLATKVGIPHP